MNAKTTPLQKDIPFGKKEVCLFMAAVVHNLDQYPYPPVGKDNQPKADLLSEIFQNLAQHHRNKVIYVLRDTVAAQVILSALRIYNADRESDDRRRQPPLAATMLATDLGEHNHPAAVAIDNLINDLEGAVMIAFEDANNGSAA